MLYNMYMSSFINKTCIHPASSGSHIGASACRIDCTDPMDWVEVKVELRMRYTIRMEEQVRHTTGTSDRV